MGTRWMVSKVAALVAVTLVLGSCLKREAFPVEPVIGMKSVEMTGDSTLITITFTDGDGDIGLAESDTFPPFDAASTYYFNLFFDPQRKVNGTWTDVNLPYYYRVAPITPTGQDKSLNGEIAWALRLQFFPLPPLSHGDTVRFNIRLVDRALHVSNTVTTEAFRAP